jgi:hypothetical protein
MRVFAAALLSVGLLASPLLAKNANDTTKDETPAAVTSAAAAEKPKESVKPESAAIESEVQDLRSLVEEQRAELEAQRAALKAQQLKMEALEEKFGAMPSESAARPVSTPAAIAPATPASSATVAVGVPAATPAAAMPQEKTEEKPSPLYFKIGAAEFYPLGFMDMTGIYRTTNLGGIGTSFGSIAFNNASPAGRLSEFRFSTQNSRIGLRTQAKFGAATVTGYLESDFLGYIPVNGNDTSNSNSLRMRLYWVDYRRGKIEFLGGQSWSFLTPNRNGLSALPGDLFYSQDVDTNYQLGLTWARQTSFRVILHPTNNWAIGVSIENPQQTLPSSVALPPGVNPGYAPAAGKAGQFDTNSGDTSVATTVTNPNVPNLSPDVILKTAFDAKPGGHQVHFDVAGLFREFKAVNLLVPGTGITPATTSISGGGIAATANVELIKNVRLIATGFYGSAVGRYIASTGGPDVIVRTDGTLSGVHAGSGIGGFEWQPNAKTIVYGYYSGAYFGRDYNAITVANVAVTGTGATGTCTVTTNYGYGFGPGSSVLNPGSTGPAVCPAAPAGSANNNNRFIMEPTFGVHYTFWRNPSYGDIRLMTQYSYVSRAPWFVATGQPSVAHNSMVYIDLRYDLP